MNYPSQNATAIEDLPKFFKQAVPTFEDARSKSALQLVLIAQLERFFSTNRLLLNHDSVLLALKDVPYWGVETVLAKLRSLVEKSARRDVGEYCRSLAVPERRVFSDALHDAGIYDFRENIETDLYVGLHTAISANFKMLGVVFASNAIEADQYEHASQQLFRALRVIAGLPLRVLMALDGLFWDSGQYTIPREIQWHAKSSGGSFYVDSLALESRLQSVKIDEQPIGCPAMRAKTPLGVRAIELVQTRCVEVAQKYYLQKTAELAAT